MNKEIHDKIVDLIPSKSLKKAIKETDFQFSELDLFRIIDACAPTAKKRIEYLILLHDELCGGIAKFVETHIKYDSEQLEYFVNDCENMVFEVYVRDYEGYIFKDFESAISFIKLYPTNEYAVPVKTYHISKRKLRGADDIKPDYFEDCDFCTVVDGEIRDIWCENIECFYETEDEKKYASLCNEESEFPKYIDSGDVIKYPDRYGNLKYAIVLLQPGQAFHYVNCTPLDSIVARCGAFDKHFFAHEYPSPYFVEKADMSELDEKMREDYLAFKAFLAASELQ